MKKYVKNPLMLFAAGLVIVGASGAGATRAAMTYSTEAEQVDFSTSKLSVDIMELQKKDYVSVKESALSFTSIMEELNLTDNDKENDRPLTIGKAYPEEVQVVNDSTGNYKEYVRVVVKKGWTDVDGKKDLFLNPSLIKLGVSADWITASESTEEEQIYYFNRPLNNGEAVKFLESITIDNEVLTYVKTVDGDVAGTVVNEYKYNDKKFFVELRVDAVQEHNAKDAILGAWGVNATLDSNGQITDIN